MKKLLAALIITLAIGPLATAQTWGRYNGPPQVEFTRDGRYVRLLRDFVYTDPKGQQWKAPRGWLVDGASIPRPLWAVAGGPFAGPYRDASIIHDFYCDRKSRPWLEVHRTFYFAMRASGVSEAEAREKYLAVYKFGPRWGEPEGLGQRLIDVFFGWALPRVEAAFSPPVELTLEEERRWDAFSSDIADDDLSLEALEAAADAFMPAGRAPYIDDGYRGWETTPEDGRRPQVGPGSAPIAPLEGGPAPSTPGPAG